MDGEATKYKVVRDPTNLGVVHIADHHTGDILIVPATVAHRQYAEGLSLTEHEIVCARADERNRKANKLAIDALMRTKAVLNEIAATITTQPSFKTTQRQLARWLEGDRYRQMRSEVQSFAPAGNDYLEALPPVAPKNVMEHVSAEDPGTASPTARRNAVERPVQSADEIEDDLEELRRQKNWNSDYD
jgi:hypothetical protein